MREINQEEIIINIYVLNYKTSVYINEILIELQGDNFLIIVEGFNNSLWSIDRTGRQKLSKDLGDLVVGKNKSDSMLDLFLFL